MTQLLALWNDWATNPTQRAKKNFGPFKQLFALLRDSTLECTGPDRDYWNFREMAGGSHRQDHARFIRN